MMIVRMLVVIGFAMLAGRAGAQVTVSNVRAEQRVNTDLVDIYFGLDKGGISDDVTFPIMLVITDGDEPVSSASATGMVTAGVDRHIVWDAAADWGMYKGSTNMSFTVRVSSTATRPSGGDATATGWQVINERWVRNFYADGAITMSDRTTGLMWVFDTHANGSAWWADSIDHCNSLVYAGHSNWFLPNRYQLSDIYGQRTFFSDIQWACYWSSTPGSISTRAWSVHMGTGYATDVHGTLARFWIWPCRIQD